MTTLFNNQLEVEKLKKRYELTAFVETGCYEGDGLKYAKKLGFESLYSCDINHIYVDKCQKLVPEATIQHSDSIKFFEKNLKKITARTLFWLDAHYPIYYGLDKETEKTRFPMLDELVLIKNKKVNVDKDVIICDDLRVLLPENNPFHAEWLGDQFLVDKTLGELIEVLHKTHDHYTVNADTGVLIFIPKT